MESKIALSLILAAFFGEVSLAGRLSDLDRDLELFFSQQSKNILFENGGDSVGTGDSGVRIFVPQYAWKIAFDPESESFSIPMKDEKDVQLTLDPIQTGLFLEEYEIADGDFCAQVVSEDGARKPSIEVKDFKFVPCEESSL
jgi:hypothetical protein